MTLLHPHNPALTHMTGGVPVFKLSGLIHGPQKSFAWYLLAEAV